MSEVEDFALQYLTCPYCGAEPPYWCTVARGRTVGSLTSYLHAGRSQPARDLFSQAFREAQGWTAKTALDAFVDDVTPERRERVIEYFRAMAQHSPW